jgi:hypothetical protein
MPPGTFYQSQLLYGIEEPCCGPVVKDFGWLFRRVLKVHFNAVTLGCPDSLAIFGELKTLLVILSHNRVKILTRDSVTAYRTPS